MKDTPKAAFRCTLLLADLEGAQQAHFAHSSIPEYFACCCSFFQQNFFEKIKNPLQAPAADEMATLTSDEKIKCKYLICTRNITFFMGGFYCVLATNTCKYNVQVNPVIAK